MKSLHISVLLLVVAVSGCLGSTKPVVPAVGEMNEGRLIYSISGEGTTSEWEFDVSFDPDNVVINERYARGAGRKYVCDKQHDEILCLYDDARSLGSDKASYFSYSTKEQLIRDALSSNYGDTSLTITQDFKEIQGYRCQKYIVAHGDQVTVEVWLTDQIKPGVIYPWTPLVFEKLALEFELKILGTTSRHYKIKSISAQPVDKREFEHVVPDQYFFVVPICFFSIDTSWSNECTINTFQSLVYPSLKGSRGASIDFLKDKLHKIVPMDGNGRISVEFSVDRDGTTSDIDATIDFSKRDKRVSEITSFIKSLKDWIPAKVKGKPVKARISIFG